MEIGIERLRWLFENGGMLILRAAYMRSLILSLNESITEVICKKKHV